MMHTIMFLCCLGLMEMFIIHVMRLKLRLQMLILLAFWAN